MRTLGNRTVLLLALALVAAAPAAALDLDANIDPTNSSVANGITVDANGNAQADLTAGDLIAVQIIVRNPPQDVLTAIFASLVYESTELTFGGGGFGDVLIESTCTGFLCTPARLSAGISAPIQKPNSPLALATGTEDWIQALAHTNQGGSSALGGEQGVIVAFTVDSNLGTSLVTIDTQLTSGDAIATTGGQPFMGVLNLEGVTINAPEPGALSASLASLVTLAGVVVHRRRRARA